MRRRIWSVLAMVIGVGPGCKDAPPPTVATTPATGASAPVIAATATSATTAPPAAAPAVAKGGDYSIPIPAGWELQNVAIPGAPGGLAIRISRRARPDHFLASIVVTAITPVPPDLAPADAAQCKTLASEMARLYDGTTRGVEIVEGPTGKTCRVDFVGNSGKQAARTVLVKGPRSAWMITSNHDPRDQDVLGACEAVVRGWKFD